jgi:hypothetical protein
MSGVKASPNKSPSKLPAGPVSSNKDIVDPIYKNEDPIGTSVGYRQKAGNI